jgi:site-specific recombinase XerD
MFEALILRRQDRARLESSPAREYLESFARALKERQYATLVIRSYLFAADRLACWLRGQGRSLHQVDRASLVAFAEGLGRRRRSGRARGWTSTPAYGARCFVTFLQRLGVVGPEKTSVEPQPESARWVVCYDEHLSKTAGLSAGTRRLYRRYARMLLSWKFGEHTPKWASLTADDLAEFIRRHVAKLKPATCNFAVTAVRSFIRFLVSRGAVRVGLEGAMPRMRQYRQAGLPRGLEPQEVEHMLLMCCPKTRSGLRDRAVLLLLARLGLRAGEVAALELDHIKWSEGALLVTGGKSRRDRSLPLSEEVGHALEDYLRMSRPPSESRRVFLGTVAPCLPLAHGGAVCTIVLRHLRRAGMPPGRRGAHLFRHSVATEMVRRGASFKQVADVLGHARLETTAIYAKLDVATLSRVAMPWPGESP